MADGKIKPDDIRIERLNSKHSEIIKDFQCYEKDLVDFLVDDAMENQKHKISATHLWFLKKTNELVGYITLLNDKINLEGNLKTFFRDKGILYKSLPALKIGRLAVDDKFQKRGLGSLMLEFAFSIAIQNNDKVGCRFVNLDAKRNSDRNKDSIHFYKKKNFSILKERIKGTTPMYFDLMSLFKEINK
ncbi:MAG: GNAT family N-acetyltransferase [Candidatus Woesearchaeota archaeon]